MGIEQLMSRYFRLKQELDMAYRSQPWIGNKIDRLANELSLLERTIAGHPQSGAAR